MQEVLEKIIDRLEERASFLSDCTKYGNKDAEQQKNSYSTMMMYEVADLVDDLIEIVKQEAGQYNNGWIPCSERLPDEAGTYNITAFDGRTLRSTHAKWQPRLKSWNLTGTMAYWKVIAWQPLPQPYKPKGE